MDADATTDQPALRCYYDADCGFCTRMVERVRKFAGLPTESVVPAQAVQAIFELMERENSWVVVDARGNRHLRWKALSVALRNRTILKPIALLMLAPGIAWIGDRVYRWIADHRGSF